jgi:hypothetical protein
VRVEKIKSDLWMRLENHILLAIFRRVHPKPVGRTSPLDFGRALRRLPRIAGMTVDEMEEIKIEHDNDDDDNTTTIL